MAVPKRRTSRSNTRHRRATWRADAPDLVPLPGTGHAVPRRLVAAVRSGLVDPSTGRPTRAAGETGGTR